MTKRIILNVALNGIEVGKIKKGNSGQISFRYNEDWISNGFQISMSMPLQEDEYRGDEVSRYFDNLLPDNDEIKKKVATKFGAESTGPFDMLHVIGKDCVGALSFVKEGEKLGDNFELNYRELSESEIAQKLKGLSSVSPLGMEENDFRISIAGAQEKTALLNIDGKWCEPQGLTPTTHIFKTSIGALGIDINFKDSIDNEWVCLAIMKKMGLDVCEAHIEKFEDQRVLAVKRFDRRWKDFEGKKILLRIPQEDLCQAMGISPYRKYQTEGGPGIVQISKLLNASNNPNDKLNFFKAMLVFDLIFATDGHAKNFSIFHGPNGFKLTPFYDVMGGYFLHSREKMPYQKLKLAMKVGNSGHYDFKRISQRHYSETAKLCGISEEDYYKVANEVKVSLDALKFEENELDPLFNRKTLEYILDGMELRSKIIFI